MAKKFQQLPRLVQILLLLIPVVNWVTEIIVRVSAVIEKTNLMNIIGLIIGLIGGVILGWIDLIWIILFKHFFLSKV
ncbi:MAG: hypothetical protein J6U25_03260 [Clostridia bacterium]|nr:hypothetical protein [Clostridia bacterium]